MTRKQDQIKRPGNPAMERGYDAALTTATWLSEQRQRCGLTQADMAQRLGKSQSAISQLEAETDTHVSTVVAYIAASGARLQFTATLVNNANARSNVSLVLRTVAEHSRHNS